MVGKIASESGIDTKACSFRMRMDSAVSQECFLNPMGMHVLTPVTFAPNQTEIGSANIHLQKRETDTPGFAPGARPMVSSRIGQVLGTTDSSWSTVRSHVGKTAGIADAPTTCWFIGFITPSRRGRRRSRGPPGIKRAVLIRRSRGNR